MDKLPIDAESAQGTPYDLTLKIKGFPLDYPVIEADRLPTKIEITLSEPLTMEEAEELGAFLVKAQKRIDSNQLAGFRNRSPSQASKRPN